MIAEPTRHVAVVLTAARALSRHAALAGHVREALAASALALASCRPTEPRRLSGRLTQVEDAVGLCACQLGLCPEVLAALRACEHLRRAIEPRLAPRTVPRPAQTLEPDAVSTCA